MKYLTSLILIVWWMAGIALAVGDMKWNAAIFPPYALYLVVEKLLKVWGLL